MSRDRSAPTGFAAAEILLIETAVSLFRDSSRTQIELAAEGAIEVSDEQVKAWKFVVKRAEIVLGKLDEMQDG